MKYITLILLTFLLSCKEVNQQPYDIIPKYKVGEIVYVAGEAFIVADDIDCYQSKYTLDKIDCRAGNYHACRYLVLEEEISKTKE